MDTEKVYKKILELAEQLVKDNSKFTRTDLAYELKDLGVDGDSADLSKIVYDAYKKFGDSKNIRDAFTDNDFIKGIVDSFEPYALLQKNETQTVIKIAGHLLEKGKTDLAKLENSIGEVTALENMETNSNVLSKIVGTAQIKKIKVEAAAVMDKYSIMIDNYDTSRNEIKSNVAVFDDLRQNILADYRKNTAALVDIFGDSIKAVAPEVFDFEKVEYLDTQAMFKNIKLEYDTLYSKCGVLFNEIKDSFGNSVRNAINGVGSKDSFGVAMASLSLIKHYMAVAEHSNALGSDFLQLKNHVRKDVSQIHADSSRLMQIYKTLNDVYIPKADAFYKFSKEIFNSDIEKILNSIYQSPEAQKLKSERDNILQQIKNAEHVIADANKNIAYYKDYIQESDVMISTSESRYKDAMSQKPQQPSGVGNALTFGSLKKKYDSKLYDWKQEFGTFTDKYEELCADAKLAREDLENQQNKLNEAKKSLSNLSQQLSVISAKIKDQIKDNPDVKRRLIVHLENMVRLLKTAKEIASAKLDENLVSTAKIQNINDLALDDKTSKNLDLFTDTLKKNLNVDADSIVKTAAENGETLSQQQASQIALQFNEEIANGVSLINQLGKLNALKQQDQTSQEFYDKQLEMIKQDFQRNIAAIDQKADVVKEILKQLNTSQNPDEIRRALLQLSDNEYQFLSQKDWDDFINGNKTIEI